MKRFALCLVALMLPVVAFAQSDGNANINIVITEPDYSGCAGPWPAILEGMDCEDLVSAPWPGQAWVWVVMSDGDMYPDGLGGIQFGIEHEKALQGWSLCTGGSEIPEDGWPNSGTGNAATWGGGCYYPPGENAVVGVFPVTDGSAGWMDIIGDPRIGGEAL